jgi:transposase-like protein
LGRFCHRRTCTGSPAGSSSWCCARLFGKGAPLSDRKGVWQAGYEAWKHTDLPKLELVYGWVNGLYVKAGLSDRKAALQLIVGATASGEKLLLACEAGERESKESWLSVLRNLKARGLKFPRLTVADGHLGIRAALGELEPTGDEQRCWKPQDRERVERVAEAAAARGRGAPEHDDVC